MSSLELLELEQVPLIKQIISAPSMTQLDSCREEVWQKIMLEALNCDPIVNQPVEETASKISALSAFEPKTGDICLMIHSPKTETNAETDTLVSGIYYLGNHLLSFTKQAIFILEFPPLRKRVILLLCQILMNPIDPERADFYEIYLPSPSQPLNPYLARRPITRLNKAHQKFSFMAQDVRDQFKMPNWTFSALFNPPTFNEI